MKIDTKYRSWFIIVSRDEDRWWGYVTSRNETGRISTSFVYTNPINKTKTDAINDCKQYIDENLLQDYSTWIGRKIMKLSGKPFKSGSKTGIPKSLEINPNSEKLAFVLDDDSIVDCYSCCIIL